MAVMLQVREVREALYQAGASAPGLGDGMPSTALLGRIFHEVFADLVGPDPHANLRAALADADPDPQKRRTMLLDHAYRRLVGPRLRRDQAHLHHQAGNVLSFWQAVQELCDWLADQPLSAGAMTPEESLVWELREPDWTDSVRLTGVADAVLRIPDTDHWCVLELKLGHTSPEADLAQVCLYHQMLAESARRRPAGGAEAAPMPGALALVSFEPRRHERFIDPRGLDEARRTLKDLIGRLAGVKSDRPATTTKPATPTKPAATVKAPGHAELGKELVRVLEEYQAPVAPDGPPIVGPTFIRFPVTLGPRVKLDAVRRLSNEVRVRLGLEAPPFIGIDRHRVVIDLQRRDRQSVRFSEVRPQLPACDPLSGNARVPLGVDLEGHLRLADLSQPEHAHLLVAGTTGSGKTEWLRVAVAGLMASNTPETLRLLLIDPKRNAFHALREPAFLFAPIIYPDEQSVAEALARLVDEMEARYQRLGQTGANSLAEYVRRTGETMPRIVCLCDEYADLLQRGRPERQALEQQIFRLGAKARAAGIHLILATQQPSREIIKGALDANIPARVGLRMEKAIESRMLLGDSGAEQLLGRGDLLFKDIGDPDRLQSAYVPDDEFSQILRGSRQAMLSSA
jgi:DNA segregation ATPase FtsK/SpoIIIE, S-DNA-T family